MDRGFFWDDRATMKISPQGLQVVLAFVDTVAQLRSKRNEPSVTATQPAPRIKSNSTVCPDEQGNVNQVLRLAVLQQAVNLSEPENRNRFKTEARTGQAGNSKFRLPLSRHSPYILPTLQ
jgi:hypothetical protein